MPGCKCWLEMEVGMTMPTRLP
eukprot:COSAG06_NODE_69989_length_194_cov_81.978947_1_plen_21_part_01